MWRKWAGLAYKSATGDPPLSMQNECDRLPFDHQSILMKDHFMGTAKIFEILIFLILIFKSPRFTTSFANIQDSLGVVIGKIVPLCNACTCVSVGWSGHSSSSLSTLHLNV